LSAVRGSLSYGGETIRYEVRFLPSRRTLGIEVHPDQRVLVRAPTGTPENVIAERVRKRAAWISRQLAEFARYHPRTPARQYISGESHLYLGRQYRLKVAPANSASIKLTRGLLLVSLPGNADPERVRAALHRWYLDRARVVFGDILDAALRQFKDTDRPRLVVRTMQSRWGSLSRAGTMTLNLNLIRAPRPCIEYVVTHELCHMKHRNHDAQFFRRLGQVMPDWEQRKQRLEGALL
jgi:predicted metal-dependent hydrolase